MKQKMAWIVLITATLALVWGSSYGQRQDSENVRAALAEANEKIRLAVKSGDAAAVARCFTEEAWIIESLKPTIRGRRAIEEYYAFWINAGLRDLDIVTDEVFGGGDTILEIGRTYPVWESGINLPGSTDMALWKRVDGRLLIHRIMSNR